MGSLAKWIFGIVIMLLLTSTLTFAFNVKTAKNTWTGTIYIRADGSIDPSNAPIISYDNTTYILTTNITSSADGIIVERDDVVIDGAGYAVQGVGKYVGLDISGRSNVTIKNMKIRMFWCGILLSHSSNNSIIGNNITDNSNYGIWLKGSSSGNIVRNSIIENNADGIKLSGSLNNKIVGNNLIRNNWYGIEFYNSSNNCVIGNNLIRNGQNGIRLYVSSNNSIYHNNFINNTLQVGSPYSRNKWDNDYPSGGNYWSNYKGVDLSSGPYQNETGSDGIGDTPYIIDKNNVDRYPLMGPFNSFNISVGYSVDVISNSIIEDFRYFESNNTIVMHVSNMTADQTFGFCRLTIPHDAISPPYTVKVNDTTIGYQTVYENHTEEISIIYFTYEHSKLEITITPEFPSITIPLLIVIITTLLIASTKKRTKSKIS